MVVNIITALSLARPPTKGSKTERPGTSMKANSEGRSKANSI